MTSMEMLLINKDIPDAKLNDMLEKIDEIKEEIEVLLVSSLVFSLNISSEDFSSLVVSLDEELLGLIICKYPQLVNKNVNAAKLKNFFIFITILYHKVF